MNRGRDPGFIIATAMLATAVILFAVDAIVAGCAR